MAEPQFRPSGTLANGRAGALGLDFHSHLLPAVDDGVKDFAQAAVTIAGLRALGFSGAVLTPHLRHAVYDNESRQLRQAFAAFTAALRDADIAFQLYLACEYFADEHLMQLIDQNDLISLRVGGQRWVLLEMSHFQETPFATACLSALVARGYRPVIAHVERYRFIAAAPQPWLARFAGAGAILQGDIGSLAGQHGEPARRFAMWLATRRQVAIWGTDIHHPAQIDAYIVPGLARLRGHGRINSILDPLNAGEQI